MSTLPVSTPKFRTLTIIGFVFACIGVAGIPIPILNNMTAIFAGVGLVLGLVGLFGSKKIMAAFAVVLAVGGVAGTIAIQNHWSHEISRITNDLDSIGTGVDSVK